MKKFVNNLKRQAEENPVLTIAVITAAATAATKMMQAHTESKNARTWEKEVDRRRTML